LSKHILFQYKTFIPVLNIIEVIEGYFYPFEQFIFDTQYVFYYFLQFSIR